jgi:hypothetical protein
MYAFVFAPSANAIAYQAAIIAWFNSGKTTLTAPMVAAQCLSCTPWSL